MRSGERAAIHTLMVRFAEGERAAFDPLFAALWPIVRSFVARTLPEADADDAAQEAIVKVFARAAEFDTTRDATTWALTIASFEVLTVRRRRTRQRIATSTSIDALGATTETPEQHAERRELLHALERTLGEIAPRDRDAIEAELRGETPTGETARKRRWRAIDRLKQLWRARHG